MARKNSYWSPCAKLVILMWLLGSDSFCQTTTPVTLSDPVPGASHSFGRRVALARDYAFVSDPMPGNGQIPGVHVYHRLEGGYNTWGWTQTIEAPTGDMEGFGSELHAWDDHLAIYQPPRSVVISGLFFCRDRSIHMFKRATEGLWINDGVIGGEVISPNRCYMIADMIYPPDDNSCMATSGNTIAVTSPFLPWLIARKRLSVFHRDTSYTWVELPGYSNDCYNNVVALIGDTTVRFEDNSSISLNNGTGPDIANIYTGTNYSGPGPNRTLDCSWPVLAISQPYGPDQNPLNGRVLFRNMNDPEYALVDSLSEDNTTNFGYSIRLVGSTLLIHEGSLPGAQRLYIYRKSGPPLNEWMLIEIVNLPNYTSATQQPSVDLNETGTAIISAYNNIVSEYEVAIWDFDFSANNISAVQSQPTIRFHFDMTTLYICCDSIDQQSTTQVSLYDITGRIVSTKSLRRICDRGIDLAHFMSGMYIIVIENQNQSLTAKLQW